jgi:hypothetical protein
VCILGRLTLLMISPLLIKKKVLWLCASIVIIESNLRKKKNEKLIFF